jgi:hypothetical protein
MSAVNMNLSKSDACFRQPANEAVSFIVQVPAWAKRVAAEKSEIATHPISAAESLDKPFPYIVPKFNPIESQTPAPGYQALWEVSYCTQNRHSHYAEADGSDTPI